MIRLPRFFVTNQNPNMNRYTSTPGRFLLLLFAIHSMALASVWEINVNTAMSEAGRKLPHPTSDQPVYYYPYCVGYQDIGSAAAKIKKLSADVPIEHFLAEALASQGYLVTHVTGTKLNPPPSLLLIFRWGYINSRIYDEDGELNESNKLTGSHQHNEGAYLKELGMLGIKDSDTIQDTSAQMDLLNSADDDRYYVLIAACDFATFYNQHKMALLWVSRMSIPRQDLELDQVVAPLIKTGTPFLGRETTKPQVVDIGGANGKVESGTPVLKGYVAPGAAQPPAPPQH
jgi:hypothetical protein